MTAQFPNVPDAPGVPAVARADAILRLASSSTGVALTSVSSAVGAITSGDYVSAAASLLAGAAAASSSAATVSAAVGGALALGSDLTGAAAGAQGAWQALQSGDVLGALRQASGAVDRLKSAAATIQNLLNPLTPAAVTGSGVRANAEIAAKWGIYDAAGAALATFDNIVAVEVDLEAQISDYVVEQGGFASYNKVVRPFDVHVIATKGGSVEDRQDVIGAVQSAWASTGLYNVVTPESVYLNVNVTSMRRSAAADRGGGLLTLEIGLRNVRQTASSAFIKTKSPAGSATTQKGSLQAAATTGDGGAGATR